MSFQFRIDPQDRGKHFYLSPSSGRLDRDRSPEELYDGMLSVHAADIGTCIHATAAKIIKNGREPQNTESLWDQMFEDMCEFSGAQGPIPKPLIDPDRYIATVQLYIHDALEYGMTPELPMKYSKVAGGTADTISWNERKRYLRIHDLKTGKNPAKMDQLLAYAGYFCLCYRKKPLDLKGIELRIYQNGDVFIDDPSPAEVNEMAERIKRESDWLMQTFYE